MPRLLYIGQAPNHGTGSPTILLRHLSRLAQTGWLIEILPEWGDDTALCETKGWVCRHLPHRQSWWPPLPIHNEYCRRMAVSLWARWLKNHIAQKPDAILCYLAWHSDLFCEIASAYGRLTGIPVTCIVHDDATHFEASRGKEVTIRSRQARILRHNHRNWFVSPEQADSMAPKGASKRVLAPLPEGSLLTAPEWQPRFAQKPTLYYAGYLWPAQARLLRLLAPILEKEAAQIVILGRKSPEVDALVQDGLASHLPLFPTNTEALAHLRSNAAGLLVSYTENTSELPWTRTSMPSKLIEYSFLGIPIALVAPEDTSVMKWARKRKLSAAFNPRQEDKLLSWVRSLRAANTWSQASAEWLELSRGEWNPSHLQHLLESSLLRTNLVNE